ncbi:MAG: DUF2752 domain-containing protein [Mesorhizobium sp.]|nr:DUF2752 domain-containing protein [Mesorhizobium sp. M1A.F.Ca.IN.022.02.1.1]RUV78758.1 DUF2752 domain-containing protein [Mesorhizobium sp. M1A.F.Ca.IN.020.30.1.1]RWG02222.1 MAG: DUF2752 domain-containing protein [Mesorhizobium sp.]RWG14852.1 MAG: DUF2752 domain-containing protein [Mesorhizobium sp.]RWG37153.1 MAG: DUF2752 domain-containing protein [Mesorhizobium sp.]
MPSGGPLPCPGCGSSRSLLLLITFLLDRC